MSYSRNPTAVKAGRALTQSVNANPAVPAGNLSFQIDSDIATPTSLGVVMIGDGLTVDSTGMVSVNGGGCNSCSYNVTLVDDDYNIESDDCYIGATDNNIELKLPVGVVGKVYIIKNQSNGNIKVETSSGQKIDSSSSVTLGTNNSLTVVFAGSRWNVI